MAKVKWTEELVIEVVNRCRIAGTAAAKAKLAELVQAGPRYAVYNSDLAGNHIGNAVGTLLDVCGFANLRISARGKFFQLAKTLYKESHYRFFCTTAYYGGGHFSVFDTTMRQEMSVNTAACKAMVPILSEYGISATVESRID
jgi:hypothetical protein